MQATDTGGGIAWFATETSTTPLASFSGLVNGEDYYADNSAGTCGSRTRVVVTIYAAPVGLSFQGVCVGIPEDATLVDLVVAGNNIQWYDQPTGGTALALTTQLVDGTIYYASQTNPNTGCETSRLSVFVNVGIVPVPTGNPNQVFCNTPGNPPTVSNLQPSGNIRWYATISSATPLTSTTPLVNGQSYFATSVDPPCESTSRFQVDVTILQPNNAGVNGVRSICISDIPTYPAFNLFDDLTGIPNTTGTWTGPLTTTNGHLGTVNINSLTVAGSPYVFTYSVSSVACPTITSTVTINVLPLPTAAVSVTNPSICSGTSTTINFNGTPNATVTYNIGGGSDQTIVLNSSGAATLTNTYTTTSVVNLVSVASQGPPVCSASLAGTSTTINVIALPTVTVSSPPVCAGQSATVTATPGAVGSYSYAWTVPSGAVNPGNVATFTTTVAGVYSVRITDLNTTCISDSVSATVVINPLPTVSVNSSIICPGQNATVTATPGSAGIYSYAWTVPSGVANPGNVPTFTTTIAGNYSVVITNTATTCVSSSATGVVTINPKPVVTVNSPSVCLGQTANLTATVNPSAGNYSYAWTVPAGATNPGNVAAFSTAVEGVYSVVVTNTVTTCSSDSASGTVTINLRPTVTVNSPSVCAGQTATVTATPGEPGTFSYAWTVPAGFTNPGNVASFSTTVAGNYSVVITNTVTTCSSVSVTGVVTINPLPTVTVNIPPICPGESATVTATPNPAGVYSYVWTVPSGVANPGNVASFSANVAGTYSVIATNTTTTCPSNPGSATLTINPLPTVVVNNPTVCAGQPATVTAVPNPAGTYSYVWTVPVGAADPGNAASFTTTIAGTYSVVATNTTTNCQSAAASGIVTLNPLPTVTVNSDEICQGETATLTATPGAAGTYTYTWTVPSGAVDPGNVASFDASVAGTYSVVITDTTTTCTSLPGSGTLIVNPLPTVTVSSTLLCAQGVSTITATPVIPGTYTYTWTVPSGVTDPGNVDTFTTAVAGTYEVVITDLVTNCSSATGAATVTISALPTVTVNSPSICPGLDATVTATPGATGNYSYAWTVPVGASDPGNVATFTTNVVGTYSVIITDLTTNCVSQSASGEVTNNPQPTVSVNSTAVCSGQSATITATPGSGSAADYSYVWTVPAGASNPGNVASFSATVAGNYSVVITNILSGCSSLSVSGTLTVNPQPTVTVNNPSVCLGSLATITAIPGSGVSTDYSFAWTVPSGATDPGNVNSFNTTVAGTYTVIITNLATTCQSNSASSTVQVNPLPTATISSSGTVCSGTSAAILFTGTPNSTVTYNNGTTDATIIIGASGTFTLNTPLTVTTTFTLVSIVMNNPPACSQNLSGSTTLQVTQPPVAGSNAAYTTCTNGPTQDLFILLGPNAQPGGTWSPALASGTNIFDPQFDSASSYQYLVAGTPPCVNDTAVVFITYVAEPNAGTNGAANLCSNIDPVDLTTYLGGTPQSGGTWSPALASGTNQFNPAVDTAGTYTYTVTGTAPCTSASAQVVVSITQGPEAGVNASVTVCVNNPTFNLFPLLGPTAQTGGTWSPALASGTDLFDPAVDLSSVYTYTLSGNNPCENDTATVTVQVNPVPDAGQDNAVNICSNAAPIDLVTQLAGTPQAGGTWSPALASGTNMFDPAVDLAGNYVYTVGAPFCNPAQATLTITIVPGPEAGVSAAVTYCVTDAAADLFTLLGPTAQAGGTWSPAMASGTGVFDPAVDAATIYTYTLSGNDPCDNDTATVNVTVNPIPNAGTALPNQDVCNSQLTIDLNSLLNAPQTGGVWTDSNSVTVNNIVDVTTLPVATYTYTYTVTNTCGSDTETVLFTVLPNPVLTGANIQVSSPNCLGDNVTVTFNNMVDGSYTLNYNLSISNVLNNQSTPVIISGGTGIMTISAADLSNTGNTRITFTNITNSVTSCTVPINPSVSADFIVRPTSDLDSSHLSIADVCSGNSVTVLISGATGLTDGNYQFVYEIPQATPTTATTAVIAIAGGSGQFDVPASVLNVTGLYNFKITSIVSLSGGCNNTTEDAETTFNVYPIPDLSAAVLTASDICLGDNNVITVNSALNLADGDYTITYELSGASTTTSTAQITVASGTATFDVPASELTNAGTVTVDITQIVSEYNCSNVVSGLTPVDFDIAPVVGTPTLNDGGNKFCAPTNPTIANLTSNISGTDTVLWYDAPTGGNLYVSTTTLIDGGIYYAAYQSTTGCESGTRLAVTVILDPCDDILIPDGFSPNNDSVNDTFEIKNLSTKYPKFKLEIYNRYGNILYKGDINTPNWDGTNNEGGVNLGNSTVPTGVYFYVLEFNDGTTKDKQGRLYLSR
ncbi:gliding motility-associated C-terminal domain-containing protein [Flavobacterium sp. CYK-55]|uniref:T9SS type B sorting domain-containing protein n=1 Tax=Flavobacterium sp. CYK-55 TaxID=2835529 RepID=UPI001BCE6907|nr:gliding motility-associated C-terminal domain-containing protein [Flavobacterium sp. CYK-55]MBS7786216.1 gliding motility-associated C-terminal domain-containing protein [Flavobacterium sp. CYK-55]